MAVAYGKTPESLVLCGLVGIMDPPRQSAIQFVETMQVGAEVKIIVSPPGSRYSDEIIPKSYPQRAKCSLKYC